jgi:hypothetical protein
MSKELAWGLRGVIPDDASAAWGARAIKRPTGFNLLSDRQAAVHLRTDGPFYRWLANVGLPWARKLSATMPGNSTEEKRLQASKGGFVLAFNHNASGGYVRIMLKPAISNARKPATHND